MSRYSLGLDFGTNSVRALLVDVDTGAEAATSVSDYISGEAGILLDPADPNLARQDPADYLVGLREVVAEVLKEIDPASVIGIGVDTTGSSPIPVQFNGAPLCSDPEFHDDLSAHCWLWKDHTAHAEAAEITALAESRGEPYLAKCGGTYSSEWFWSKVLHCARSSPRTFARAHSWVECCDWIVGYLTDRTDPLDIPRSVCAAGHKAMYAEDWGGLPSKEFLAALDPALAGLRDRLYSRADPSSVCAGGVSEIVAAATGLRQGTPVAVGSFDAHCGAVGSGVKPGVLVKIMGTSTCDCMVHPLESPLPDIPGLCGIVAGSILPGCYGLEAGQSAVGDIFRWFAELAGRSQEDLSAEASLLRPGQSGLLALDWNNGNRTVLVDPLLTGLVVGQTLHTSPGEVYRALIESTAFGGLAIMKRLEEYGVRVNEVVCCGGIADKSPLVMQIYADVCNRPMKVVGSSQTCALGAAIFGAVAGGAHPSAEAAQEVMAAGVARTYTPDPANAEVYCKLYRLYMDLHDSFGGVRDGILAHVMKELIAIRGEARG